MKSIYQPATLSEINNRLNSLQPTNARLWGKMDAPQMMAHCSEPIQVAMGESFPPRIFLGRILGPLMKKKFVSEAPFGKNYPTDKNFIMNTPKDFEKEKARLAGLINQFAKNGPEKCSTHPHSFFGKLTPEQWGIVTYKHLDHHLRQFGA
jgi:hypothetical protein